MQGGAAAEIRASAKPRSQPCPSGLSDPSGPSGPSGAADPAPATAAAAAAAGDHEARLLTARLVAAPSWRALRRAARDGAARGGLNAIHVSAALARLARLVPDGSEQRQDPHLLDFLSDLEAVAARLLAAPRHAAAVAPADPLVARGAQAAAPAALQRLQQERAGGVQQVAAPEPQQLATIAWAWGSLRHDPSPACWDLYWGASVAKLGQHTPQELAMALWGLGRLRRRPPAGWMAAFEAASRRRLWAFKPQELSMVLWALAALGLPPSDGWWRQARAAALAKAPAFAPRDAAQVLWAAAALGVAAPADWVDGLLRAVQGQLPLFCPHDVSNTVWALGRLGRREQHQQQQQQLDQDHERRQESRVQSEDPSAARAGASDSPPAQHQQHGGAEMHKRWVGRLLLVLEGSNVKTACTTLRQHANILWALAALGMQPSASWASIAWSSTGAALAAATSERQRRQQQAALASDEGPPGQRAQPARPGGGAPPLIDERDAAQIAWAAAALPQGPGGAWLRTFWAATGPDLPGYGAQAAAVLLWATARLGPAAGAAAPPAAWAGAALAAVRADLASLQPPGACQLLWALAALRHPPSEAFMRQALARLQLELHLLPPAGFACVLCALGALGYCPGDTWWDTLWYCLRPAAHGFGARELAGVLFGAAALGRRPPPRVLRALGARALAVLPRASAREQGALLSALARAGWRPEGGAELRESGRDPASSLSAAAAAAADDAHAQVLRAGARALAGAGAGPGASAADVVGLLAGVRRLGVAPDAAWLRLALGALDGRGGNGRGAPAPRDAAAAVAVLAALGAAPEQGWVEAMVGAMVVPCAQEEQPPRQAVWQQQHPQPAPTALAEPSLLDSAAAGIAGWTHVALPEPLVRALLEARLAARARQGGRADDVPMAAWEALAGRRAR